MIGMMSWFTGGLLLAQERAYEWGWGMHPMGGFWRVWGIGMMFFWVWLSWVSYLVSDG